MSGQGRFIDPAPSYPCTCPDRRNDLNCPAHVLHSDMVGRYIARHPIYVEIAFEMDLHWATDQVRGLFFQQGAVPGWHFTAVDHDAEKPPRPTQARCPAWPHRRTRHPDTCFYCGTYVGP